MRTRGLPRGPGGAHGRGRRRARHPVFQSLHRFRESSFLANRRAGELAGSAGGVRGPALGPARAPGPAAAHDSARAATSGKHS
ncbi:hypothetical protein EVAR_61071_1 [Eumeta japonica]|uniref:Uncharacterized protein n=1 Tax=Eumeta variegata TaxID=151549 RepID=A0A4C1ZAN5_EUMVA|nr:hypothetical protein EVAR_61071_1 [Eumeta japonica]